VRRLVVLLLLAALAAGIGFAAASAAILRDDVPPAVSQAAREVRERVTRTAREAAGRAAGEAAERAPGPRVTSLRKARCPEGAEAPCRAVRGRIVYVERVDPDGDGDLHVVVADGSITAPGLTSIDVRPGLRPDRDPRVGDVATAAGPVQRGSVGQRQVHALVFRVARAS
jgi:hypothetical protein